MSNKIALIIVALFATLSLTAQTVSEDNDTIKRVGNHSWKDLTEQITPETTGWSIFINGGFSHFDGDNGVKLATSEQMSFDGGLGLEYTFTPLWSIMAEWHTTTYGQHMFDKSRGFGDPNNPDPKDLVTNGGRSLGHLNTVGVGIEFNLMDAIFPRDKKNLFNVYLQAGGGLGIYSYRGSGYNYYYNSTTGELDKSKMETVYNAYTNGKGKWVASDKSPEYSKTNTAAYIFAGVLAEFNVTRVFGIGLRAYYDYFMNDYIDGGTSANNKNNKNNDGLFACDVNFRFNILAKQKSHWRNIASMDEFYKMFEDENLKKALAGLGDGDGRDRLKDTLVISHKDTIVSIEKTKQEVKLPDRHFYVYFDNDKDNVKPEGQITIQQVAELLESNPNLCAEIVGQCDNTGNLEYNKKLAQRRANNVLEEFVEEFGFDSERAYTVSKGIVVSKRSKNAFGPNRRVDIHIVEKEKFLEMKAAHEAKLAAEKEAAEKAAEKPAEEKVAEPIAEAVEAAAAEVKDNAESLIKTVKGAVESAKEQVIETEQKITTVQDGETLSKIARREYGNVNCWVYIYEANAVRLGNNASSVRPGMVLFLPTLTEAQLAITKEEAHARYEARK